eukprot:TRINITY_DN18632_c0_g1_i1.p1 TRINITY_DN18632_c0_g1~~TRINITY_DN18632_c0_g1_i1.p1  ORF type:complete len:445 (-),score=46.75 TRINITY_DN18632_c0_g1_i1:67-1362(-)
MESEVPFLHGKWPGSRNNYDGEAGFAFRTSGCCAVVALGRAVPPGGLKELTAVTLWDVELEIGLATVDVGPGSIVEGAYAFEKLPVSVGLEADREYRLTQTCYDGMLDPWFDGKATAEEVEKSCHGYYAKLGSGVCCNTMGGFPRRCDGDFRRAGMVNFKILKQERATVALQREQFACSLAQAAASEEGVESDALEVIIAVVATLLSVLVDCLPPAASALVLVLPAEELDHSVHARAGLLEPVPLEELPYSVFDDRFAPCLVGLAERRNQGLELARAVDAYGGPTEGAVVIDGRTGRVLAAGVSLRFDADAAGPDEASFREIAASAASGARLAMTLKHGMVLSRSEGGSVTAFLSSTAHDPEIEIPRLDPELGSRPAHNFGAQVLSARGYMSERSSGCAVSARSVSGAVVSGVAGNGAASMEDLTTDFLIL